MYNSGGNLSPLDINAEENATWVATLERFPQYLKKRDLPYLSMSTTNHRPVLGGLDLSSTFLRSRP